MHYSWNEPSALTISVPCCLLSCGGLAGWGYAADFEIKQSTANKCPPNSMTRLPKEQDVPMGSVDLSHGTSESDEGVPGVQAEGPQTIWSHYVLIARQGERSL